MFSCFRRRLFFMKLFRYDFIPYSYVLLLFLVANFSKVLFEERQMWLDIGKTATEKAALSTSWQNAKPFFVGDVNGVVRITELDFHCSEDHPPWLLVVVFSRAQSRMERDIARKSWIERLLLAERPGAVKVVFVISVKRDVDLVLDVRDEYRARRDLLVLLMNESPQDMVVKTLAAFQWINEGCHGARHILKIEDDTHIHANRFRNFVRTIAEHKRYENAAVIFGQCLETVKVSRNPKDQWFVPATVYENATFPTFCTGAAYLMNQEMLTLILSNMFALPDDYLLPFEDILITGILTQPNAIHVTHPGFANVPIPASKYCRYHNVFAIRSANAYEMENFPNQC